MLDHCIVTRYAASLGCGILLLVILLAPVGRAAADPAACPIDEKSRPATDDVARIDKNPVIDLYAAGRTLVTDAAHIYTAPVRMSGSDALEVAVLLAATGLVFAFDQDILDLVQRNENEGALRPLWDVADFAEPVGHMGNTNAYYFGGVAVGYVTGVDELSLICAQILESHFIAGLGKNAIGWVAGRHRPFEGGDPYSFGNDNATSLPSGHAINIFQLATILSYHVDRPVFTWAAYATAGLVGIQRVRANMHWPSDVLISAVYGTAVARAVLKLHEGRELSVAPHVSELGVGMQVGWRF